MGAFTDLEMKRERSKRNKREREKTLNAIMLRPSHGDIQHSRRSA